MPPAEPTAGSGDTRLIDYYSRRVPEYEEIYRLPERQVDLRALAAFLPGLVAGRDVLEIACGTGYWTERMTPAARSWLATDLSAEMLDAARGKSYPSGRVRFAQADAYALESLPGRFDALVSGFLWSHLPRTELPALTAALARRLQPGARMVFFDNRYVAGSSSPMSRYDQDGNTWQRRQLRDGSSFEVIKNFPTAGELLAAGRAIGGAATVIELRYFWCLAVTTAISP
jgi:demethylmenaquinone methyltransferase/2-methoxy-6-polyprenyl-1,4-benzoquinol methylase